MKRRFPDFVPVLWPVLLPVLGLVLGLTGCSGLPEQMPAPAFLAPPATPTPVVLPRTAPPAHPFVPGVHRYVEPEERLSFPTATPAPTRVPTSRPTAAPARRTPVPTPRPTLEPPGFVWQTAPAPGEPPSCVDRYRRMLIDYQGRIPFGAAAAWALARELREGEPACAVDSFAPELAPGTVCVSGTVAGLNLSPGLT